MSIWLSILHLNHAEFPNLIDRMAFADKFLYNRVWQGHSKHDDTQEIR